ncbi:MAG: response regulator transcription factor [Promethearchaeota archaeon]
MASKNSPKIKILLADDSETFLRAAKLLLTDYDVETAIDGEDALKKIKANQPNIFFVDLVLPKISGTSLISQVKEKYPKIAIIAITAIDDNETVEEVLRLGAIGYLIKGALSKETFKEIIQRVSKNRS